MTTTGFQIVSKVDNEKNLPCFTIRPIPSFKTRGLHYTSEAYDKNSFTLHDIFHNETLILLRNTSLFQVKKQRSMPEWTLKTQKE